jgi:hypothetical protein
VGTCKIICGKKPDDKPASWPNYKVRGGLGKLINLKETLDNHISITKEDKRSA